MNRATLAAVILALAPWSAAAQGPDVPCEAPIAGIETTCGWVAVDGYRVRSIVTRPAGVTRARLPALLFVQWLSCDPVSVTPDVSDGWQDVLRALVRRSGMVVARTEKPGLGGSGGPACEELGYDEEVAVHRAALEQLRHAPNVDPDSIFIVGGSMGGTIAPLIAPGAGDGLRGLIVAGTTAGTWLEHMIALDRRVMELQGLPADSVHALLPDHARFHSAYLADGRAPVDVARDWTGARAVWLRMIGTDTLLTHQYGRPVGFHQEAQRHNWPRAWGAVRASVLVVHGEHDWIMPEDEHLRILRSLAAAARRQATYQKVPGMGHDFLIYPSLEDSFHGRNGRFDVAVAETMLDWLRARRERRRD
jgi:pimeloyl-ACP methyl ester carboxylesterase